jgi:hypothetical protein
MKHSNDGGVLKGAHEYKNGSYQEVPNFQGSEYPKHYKGQIVNNADEEAALNPKEEAAQEPKEVQP